MTHLLANVFGIHMSQGTVDNMLQRLAIKATPFYVLIRNELENSKQAVGADETSCSVSGDKHWA